MSMEVAAPTAPAQVPYFGGPWFLSPTFEQALAERRLDPEVEIKVRSFAERGYVILDDLGFDDFDGFADRLQSDLEPLHEGGRYNRIMDAWTVSDPVRELATSPRILGFLEVLYGRRPVPFQTLNFLRGSQQPTHSDAYHFHSYPKHFMCGVWVAFEDTDDENGPLHYYPGSHRLPDYDFLCPGDEGELHEFVEREVIPGRGLTKELGYLKRGQALIWAANLLHGGDPVTKPERTRKSQVTHCYFDGCSYYTPFRSDFARGKVFFRQITDVTTGKLHPLPIATGRVRPPLISRAVTWRRRFERMLGRGYVQY
jgi:phytanoyl-CoA dioxygenase PhyH